jgi:hypothetical protein
MALNEKRRPSPFSWEEGQGPGRRSQGKDFTRVSCAGSQKVQGVGGQAEPKLSVLDTILLATRSLPPCTMVLPSPFLGWMAKLGATVGMACSVPSGVPFRFGGNDK